MKRSSSSKPTAGIDRQAEIQQILAILHKWGIHTLDQLAVLDREELRARLGTEGARMWERANGLSNRLLKFVQPPESFEENFEFENEIETAEPLLFILRRFLEQVALRLTAIYLVAQELILRMTFANKQTYERVFQIPQPTNDVDLLFRMLYTHLENFKSEYPITAVALEAQPVTPPEQQFGFFETTLRNPHQLSETFARLSALLGADRVGRPVLEDTHRPDAFHIEPFVWDLAANTATATEEKHPAPRVAMRRFRPAVSASVLLDEDKPAHIRSAVFQGKVVRRRGPYLLSGNWWDEKSWAHAEWDVQLENGILCRSHQSGKNWEIDGVYD
jgi:protein ImuB